MRLHLIILFFGAQGLFAQTLPFSSFVEKNEYYAVAKARIDSGMLYHVQSNKAFSGFILKVTDTSFSKSYLVLDKDTVFLQHDSHNDWEGFYSSQLISCNPHTKVFTFYTDKVNGSLEIHFLTPASRKAVKKKESSYRLEEFCAEPAFTSQSIWRLGLPDPIGTPISTAVHHIIVHHSAGSNLVQDYLQEIRNIYLLHTQVNGYDDIGYNYLIAPDGVIFKGRDGRGLVDQDNVRGAHMCNKNDSTMAICLLGNFVSQVPTNEALNALYSLAGWKSSHSNLEVFGYTYHSIGPTSAQASPGFLANVAAHRDGCTPNYTECPGEMLYQLLPSIRKSIADVKGQCLTTNFEIQDIYQKMIRVNELVLKIPDRAYTQIKLFNLKGILVHESGFLSEMIVPSGFYMLVLEGQEQYMIKIVVP